MIDMEEIDVGIFSLVNTSIYPQGMSDGLTEIYIELFWFTTADP